MVGRAAAPELAEGVKGWEFKWWDRGSFVLESDVVTAAEIGGEERWW